MFGAVGAICLGMTVPAQAASIFNIEFDGQSLAVGDGPLVGPIIGNGTFISPFELNPGTYDLSSLTGFSLNFSFLNGQVYSTSDIQTPLGGVDELVDAALAG
jgi:hypothetical protein